jgi:hypothetical protein
VPLSRELRLVVEALLAKHADAHATRKGADTALKTPRRGREGAVAEEAPRRRASTSAVGRRECLGYSCGA